MDIIEATERDAGTHIDRIPDLVFATGPASYGYQFGSRAVLDPLASPRAGRRVHQCSWLNPAIPDDVYYVHTLSIADARRDRVSVPRCSGGLSSGPGRWA